MLFYVNRDHKDYHGRRKTLFVVVAFTLLKSSIGLDLNAIYLISLNLWQIANDRVKIVFLIDLQIFVFNTG